MSEAAGTGVAVEEVQSRAEQKAAPLYAGRVEVYAKAVRGTFRNVKWAALIVLLGIYYLVPWIRYDRGPEGPDQAVLVDMGAGRLYFFWIEIWPQEVYFLTGILILASFALFLATALFGRVWCGFACPQTVWTDLYMMVERWLEGDRNQRIKFDKAPWTQDKIIRRSAKHAIWLFIAFWTGGAWIMYFNDAPTITVDFWTGHASLTVYFFIGLFTATTYLLAGHAREQVCTYMCPWPRIQGALVDQDTMAVTYEEWRGEPRGKHKKGTSWEIRGHCVDCKQCVAVCPMGIDIRDGFQLECIGCGLCIDACDGVMDKLGLPPKLISYESERNLSQAAAGESRSWRLIRPRTVLYYVLIPLVVIAMLSQLFLRATSDVNILHDRNPLFVTMSDGSIRNGYTFKILNKERRDRVFAVTVEGLDGLLISRRGTLSPPSEALLMIAPPDGIGNHKIFLQAPRAALTSAETTIDFVLVDQRGDTQRHKSIFRGPDQ